MPTRGQKRKLLTETESEKTLKPAKKTQKRLKHQPEAEESQNSAENVKSTEKPNALQVDLEVKETRLCKSLNDYQSAEETKLATKQKVTDKAEDAHDSAYSRSPDESREVDYFDDEDEFLDLEKRRQENIRQNKEFFEQLGVLSAKTQLVETIIKNKQVTRGYREKQAKPKEILPPRKSLRLQNKSPSGAQLPNKEPVAWFTPHEERPRRKHASEITMHDCIVNELSGHEEFLENLQSLNINTTTSKTKDLQALLTDLNHLSMSENTVAKVVPDRVFSLAFHPTEDKILIIAGDKWGKLGFWDMDSRENQDGVFVYEPHTRPVKCLTFNPHQTSQLYTASYDGTVRCCHLNEGKFTTVYCTPEDEDVLIYSTVCPDANTLLIGQNNGHIVDFDKRSGKPSHDYNVGQRSVRCLSLHPQQHYMASAHITNCVLLWDRRNMKPKSPLAHLVHGKSVESAYFSPVSGSKLLTTAADDRLRVYDSSDVCNTKILHSIPHNNWTGRWLTNFRATWHPLRDDMFTVGSMERPRRMQVYGSDGKLLKVFSDPDYLGSVSSLTIFHPTLNVLAGANSSGKVHVFR